MIDEKNLQSEKLEDEELEKVSGGYSGRVAGGILSDPFAWKKNIFSNEEPKNNSGSILGNSDGGH